MDENGELDLMNLSYCRIIGLKFKKGKNYLLLENDVPINNLNEELVHLFFDYCFYFLKMYNQIRYLDICRNI